MKLSDITAAIARKHLQYNPDTGTFTRLRKNGEPSAKNPASPSGSGYLYISLCNNNISAHRIAWLLMTGEWPESMVDHRNGDRHDNRWLNLRASNHSHNNQNKTKTVSSTGFMGVYPERGRYRAVIKNNNRQIYLGAFSTPEAAHHAYLQAKRRYHPHAFIAQ